MTTEKLHVIIPVTFLKEAEKEYTDAAAVIGPYIEAQQNDAWEVFYDKVGETLPLAGDREDIFFNEKDNRIENFDILSDQLVSAFTHIKHELAYTKLPLTQYEVLESRKIDSNSVAVTLILKKEAK